MIGSLFRLGMLATLVGGSTFALIGPQRLHMYLESGKERVLSAIDEAQGMESKLGLIRTQIHGLDKETRGLKEEAIRRNVEVESLRAEIEQRQKDLDRRADTLEKVKEMLGDGRSFYVIGGMRYTRAAVEQDAAEKLSLLSVQSETLNSLRETLATKEKAQSISEQNVARAAALRIELDSKVGLLEAQLQKFRAKQHFAATAAEVMDTGSLDSDLAKAREMIVSFEKDLQVQSRMLEEQLLGAGEQPKEGIDYEAIANSPENLASSIDEVLARVRNRVAGTCSVTADVPTVH